MREDLRGFCGQSMTSGKPVVRNPQPYMFPPRSTPHSFTIPQTGYWKFVAWGPGGVSDGNMNGGGGGGYGEVTRWLGKGEVVTITSGEGAPNASNTTIIIRTETFTATKGGTPAGGTASGFDVNLTGGAGGSNGASGSPGSGSGGGAGGPSASSGTRSGGGGAPAILPYRGGAGGNSRSGGSPFGGNPGGGGGNANVSAVTGGDGLVLALLLRTPGA